MTERATCAWTTMKIGENMKRTKPPFRADHVGSLLRPAALKEAREKRAKGEISAGRAQGGRGPRDRARHQEAGGGRPAGRHRRRVPPLLVAPRLPLGRSTAPSATSWTPASRSPARARTRNEGVRVTGKLGFLRPSDDRAFQVRGGAHQAHAEDHDPGAVGASTAARSRDADRQVRLSVARRSSSPISARPTARPCAPSPTPAAATCSSTKCSSPCCAIPNYRQQMKDARRRSAQARRALRRPHQRRDGGHPRRHDHHHASVPRQLPLDLHGRAAATTPVPEILFDKHQGARLFHGIRQRARRRLRAAAALPKGKTVVLGLVTTKTGELETRTSSSAASTRRRNSSTSTSSACRRNAASPRPRRATSLTEDEQWAKLRMIVEVADEVWGR